MQVLKEVFKHEVYPALGCTEPIAIAYAAGVAGNEIDGEIEEIDITVDTGVYKNGFAVTVPNTGGKQGNLIAGVLGAMIKRPELKMEILKSVQAEMVGKAEALISAKKAAIGYDKDKSALYIEVLVKAGNDSARAVIEGSHTNLVYLEKNDRVLLENKRSKTDSGKQTYRDILRKMKISELIVLAREIDHEDYQYIKQGIDMNLEISKVGLSLEKVGNDISELIKKGLLTNNVFVSSKILVASAVDARMGGLNYPVMSSGGSGNQGVVATLVPYNVGKSLGIEEARIIQSIALSHLINSYIKCFTGDLSPICGCSIAAGVAAAAAIVYQQCGNDMKRITLAVNNIVGDLGGMLCDGAKAGCAHKVVSATDATIRSAFMAMNDHGISEMEGFIGRTAEETIWNLAKISNQGMEKVDGTILEIMNQKS